MPGVKKGTPRAPKWSLDEDALLRKVWGEPAPLKTVLHLFPLRTEVALVARGRDLKLADRRRTLPAQRAAQGNHARIKAILEARRATTAELAILAGCSEATVRRFIAAHRAEMRIGRFLPNGEDGPGAAVWAWGAGIDAKRPAKRTRPELSARYNRKLKRERPEKLDQIRAKQRIRAATKAGKFIRRDPLVAALFGVAE